MVRKIHHNKGRSSLTLLCTKSKQAKVQESQSRVYPFPFFHLSNISILKTHALSPAFNGADNELSPGLYVSDDIIT